LRSGQSRSDAAFVGNQGAVADIAGRFRVDQPLHRSVVTHGDHSKGPGCVGDLLQAAAFSDCAMG